MTQKENNVWKISRTIPMTLIFALLVQSVAMTWWAAGIDFQVKQNKRDLETLMISHEKVLRLEAIMEGMLYEIKELRSDLRRINANRQ